MVFVDDAGGVFPSINHSPWNGVTLADFVMPFFLFIVGVALVLAYKVYSPHYHVIFFLFAQALIFNPYAESL